MDFSIWRIFRKNRKIIRSIFAKKATNITYRPITKYFLLNDV